MISIIVPVYNVEAYLARCVESILGQTFREFELILVDDGSTDDSGRICDSFQQKDARIRVIHQENLGLSEARNRGIQTASGEYMTCIDSDDYIEPEYLEILYKHATEYQAQVSVCAYRMVWEQTGKNKEKPEKKQEETIRQYTGREAVLEIVKNNQRGMITAWGKLYHSSLREWLHYPAGRLHEDEFVTYQVLYHAKQVVVSSHPYYLYVQRGESIMNEGFSEKRLDKLMALKEAITFFRERQDRDLEAFAIKRYLLNLQIAWYRAKKFMPDKKQVRQKLRDEWKESYRLYKAEILKRSGLIDKISVLIYAVSPGLYGMAAGFYLKMFPEV